MRGPFGRNKRIAPREKIIWGQKGVKNVRYLGDMPQDFRGGYTDRLYAFNERRPLLGVDVRDLPSLAKAGGRENFEGLPDPPKAKKAPKKKEEKPQAEAEVKDE